MVCRPNRVSCPQVQEVLVLWTRRAQCGSETCTYDKTKHILWYCAGTMYEDRRTALIKLAADGVLDSHAPEESEPQLGSSYAPHGTTQVALTADNLEQIPEAEHLAPGIRLDEPILNEVLCEPRIPVPEDASKCNQSIFGLEHEPVEQESVPPELDPRTSEFRPGIPSAGSVFSVAVQPGSPKSVTLESGDRTHDLSGVVTSSQISSRMDSSMGESVCNYRFTTPFRSMSIGTASSSRANSVSVANSEAGSITSDATPFNTEFQEQEFAIEQQRMRERAISGGELGIGGPISPHVSLPQVNISQPQRTFSSSATIGSSPATSVRDGDPEIPTSPTANKSRRVVDSPTSMERQNNN